MTVEVGYIIKSILEPLRIGGSGLNPFIDKLAGVVKTIYKTDSVDGKTVRKSFPVSCGMDYPECISNGRYKDLVPNSKLGCIVYLEDLGARLTGTSSNRNDWKASYRLVGWVNQAKLGYEDCSITSKIINTIIATIPEGVSNSGIYQRGSIEILGQDPRSFDPFSKYTYDEEKTQYKMYPFDYFSLLIDVNFSVDKRCTVTFTKQAEVPCV